MHALQNKKTNQNGEQLSSYKNSKCSNPMFTTSQLAFSVSFIQILLNLFTDFPFIKKRFYILSFSVFLPNL
jgi:hypothetical protein